MIQVLLAGAAGFLGTHLREALLARGHAVTSLTRGPARDGDQSTWDPYAGALDPAVVEAADVVVNLAGSPTLGNPHSEKWARELRESRVTTTRVLAEAIAAVGPPAGVPGRQRHLLLRRPRRPRCSTRAPTAEATPCSPRSRREWQAAAEPGGRRGSPGLRAAHRAGDGPAQRSRSSCCGCSSAPGSAAGWATAVSRCR